MTDDQSIKKLLGGGMAMETFSLLNTAVTVPLLRNSAWKKIVIRNVTIVLALALPAWLHAGETGHSI